MTMTSRHPEVPHGALCHPYKTYTHRTVVWVVRVQRVALQGRGKVGFRLVQAPQRQVHQAAIELQLASLDGG